MDAQGAAPIVVRRRDGVIFEPFESEMLLCDLETDRSVRLNVTGSKLWRALAQPTGAEELSRLLVSEWGIALEQARRDVQSFLRYLVERELVELVSGSGPG